MNIRLDYLKPEDEEQFILDNQAAFNYGAKQYLIPSIKKDPSLTAFIMMIKRLEELLLI